MGSFRRSLFWSGLAGLMLAGLSAMLATWLVTGSIIRPPLPQRLITLVITVVSGSISLLEIPLMVFAMRRLVAERPANRPLVLGLNGLYVLFAGVYALPVLLLTGSLALGWILCSLGLVRLATALLLIREGKSHDDT